MSNLNIKSEASLWIVGPFRLVLAFFLFGWFVKVSFFGPFLFDSVFDVPLFNDFFPVFFQANSVSASAYLTVLLGLVCFVTKKVRIYQFTAILLVACAAVLCLHQNTHNDATFIVSFWVALWLLWLSVNAPYGPQAARHAAILASCIVGLMFLGGFVGKLMPRYMNGAIIGRIFLEQGGESPLLFLFGAFDAQQTRLALSLIAKLVIFGEGLLALNLVIHKRSFRVFSLAVIPMLVLFSSWRILSVVAGLIGLLIATLMMKNDEIKS